MRDADAVTARRERQLEPAVVAARTAQRRACRRALLRRDFGTGHGCAAWVGERSAKGCSGLRVRAKAGEQNPDQTCEQPREAKSHGVSSSPSRAGVEGCPEKPGSISRAFWAADSAGLLAWRHNQTARPSRSDASALQHRLEQWPALDYFSALQSRGGDGFSPSSRARSLRLIFTAPSSGGGVPPAGRRRVGKGAATRPRLRCDSPER